MIAGHRCSLISPVVTSNSSTCGRVKLLHLSWRDDGTLAKYAVLGELHGTLQDAPLSGVNLPVALLARLAKEVPQVAYFKIEVPNAAAKLRGVRCLKTGFQSRFPGLRAAHTHPFVLFRNRRGHCNVYWKSENRNRSNANAPDFRLPRFLVQFLVGEPIRYEFGHSTER